MTNIYQHGRNERIRRWADPVGLVENIEDLTFSYIFMIT